MDIKENLQGLVKVSSAKKANPLVIAVLGVFGGLLIVAAVWIFISDWRSGSVAASAQREGQQAVEFVAQKVQQLNRNLGSEAVIGQALEMLGEQGDGSSLIAQLKQVEPAVNSARVWSLNEIKNLRPREMGPNGFAVLDMLLSIVDGQPPLLQFHRSATPEALFEAVGLQADGVLAGVMLVSLDPAFLTGDFNPAWSSLGYLRLAQYNGRQPSVPLAEFGDASRMGEIPDRIPVAGSLFRVEFPQVQVVKRLSTPLFLAMLAVGALCVLASVVLHRRNQEWLRQHRAEEAARQRAKVKIIRKTPGGEQPETAPALTTAAAATSVPDDGPVSRIMEPSGPVADSSGGGSSEEPAAPEPLPEPPPMRLHYDIAERRKTRETDHEPVELVAEIFRAYDIRGVIDKTLDSGVARQVGQAIGTLALEADAAPVVVARDGRLSGPYLMDGMIEGITSAGCDVLDVGAVPTGVLYYAAHEKASGSGVMITGSHNPPDYNGFKIMIAGAPLSGDEITGIYRMIRSGKLRSGMGEVTEADVVQDYIDRIASDIKLEKPMKVVMDCGNGIGGVCAADTLRAIGAEVLPLFDEVDGTFPNHHPDPSDPENLDDLIAAVRLMDADLGLALDGDADRLGVVTLAGDIIYPDRVMMLLALDVLDRNPGATIIYDVKCTQHLPRVIEEAGGKAVMYKTGHSLIKKRMKEVGSPFAGEMSGHFFFGERWYGVDDGIYAAARLLEILAGTETPPEAILSALPSSYSTPELKVQMEEGENHAFIEEFRRAARFDGAEVHTIDGLRADFSDGWGLVRASNTTPIMVVRFDADSEVALERIKNLFRVQMLELRPDLELPF
jgi:phosphomannomutase